MKQLTKEEAIAFAGSKIWKKENWSCVKIAKFQIQQECLCMDFGDFHGAVEKALGKPVWTHQFIEPWLKEELLALSDS